MADRNQGGEETKADAGSMHEYFTLCGGHASVIGLLIAFPAVPTNPVIAVADIARSVGLLSRGRHRTASSC